MQWIKSNPFVYIIFPTIVSLTIMMMYFGGNSTLQSIIVPTMPTLHTNSWREFGLLENIQHLYILAILFISLHAFKLKSFRFEKVAALGLAALALLVLLEEIDYGLHYYEWLHQIPADERTTLRNLHNTSNEVLQNIRRTVDICMALLFLVAPIIANRFKHPLITYLAPSRWLLGTALCIILLSEVAHFLDDQYMLSHTKEEHLLYKNVSEFREITVYYIFLIYIWQIVYRRECQGK